MSISADATEARDVATVRDLMSQGKGDRLIGEAMNITRHQARNLMGKARLGIANPDNVIAAPLADITASPNSRVVRDISVAVLAESIREIGLMEPVILRRKDAGFEIIAGRHRVEAFRLLGRDTIPALVREATDLLAELMLIDENLCRNEFSPAERAIAISRRKAIYLELHPDTAHGAIGNGREKTRQVGDSTRETQRFTKATAEAVGIAERTIQRDASRGERIGDDNLKKIVGTSLDKGEELDALTKLSEPRREALIKRAAAGEDVSARKPDLVNGARSIMGSRQEPDDSLDFFPTPPWATRALMEVVLPPLGCNGDWRIWEPACGEGHMSEVLREYSDHVCATDIFNYGPHQAEVADFLEGGPPETDEQRGLLADWIITNPPFGDHAIKFVLRALDLAGEGVAMFFRSQWAVEGIERYEAIFRDRPPTLCAYFVERVNLCKGRWDPDGSTATAYCWLVWVKDRPPLPPFWIPPGQRERLSKPDDRARFAAWSIKESIDPNTGEISEAAE